MNKVLFVNKGNPESVIPQMLATSGYEVIRTGAGDVAGALETARFDLVILIENAGAESWSTCFKIRQLTTSPLIVISAGASAESCVKAIEAGADFFLRKPFGPMELLSRISTLFMRLPARQPAAAN